MNKDEVFLRHILDEIEFLSKNCEGIKLEDLTEDTVLQRAVVRSLEVVGEAVKNLSEDFKKKHPDIEWKKIAGLRDKLIHRYFGVDWDIVWDVINDKLPNIQKEIKKLIN